MKDKDERQRERPRPKTKRGGGWGGASALSRLNMKEDHDEQQRSDELQRSSSDMFAPWHIRGFTTLESYNGHTHRTPQVSYICLA